MINEIPKILKKRVAINDKDPIIDEILLLTIIPFLRGKKKGEDKR